LIQLTHFFNLGPNYLSGFVEILRKTILFKKTNGILLCKSRYSKSKRQ